MMPHREPVNAHLSHTADCLHWIRSLCFFSGGENRWDEFYMAPSATTINENGKPWQYAVPRRVVQRSSTLLVLESPRMSLTRDALWHNGL